MRLLIATPLYPPDIGGPASYAKHFHDEWVRAGHAVTVIAYGRVERSLPALVRHLWYFFRLMPHMLRADWVIALDTWSVGLPALAAASLTRARLAVRIGGDALWEAYVARTHALVRLSDFYIHPRALSYKERFMRHATTCLTRHADRLVFNTRWQRGIWARVYGFAAEEARVVENTIPERNGAGWKGGPRIFVASGREHALKNYAVLAQAFARLKDEFSDIELDTRICAPGEHQARIARAYAVVIPSVSEVSPNTAVDALVAGIPFIAPKDSGMPSQLPEEGIYIDTLSSKELEGALRDLLNADRYREQQMRIQAFARTRPWNLVAQEFLAAVAP